MTRDSSSKGPAKGFTIDLPEGVRKNLPKDFDIGDIGNIDLLEAEAIANENVLLLNENDLIEGLEDFDLIPLKEDVKAAEDTAERGSAAPPHVRPAVTTMTREYPGAVEREEKPVSAPVREEARETAAVSVEPVTRKSDEAPDDGRTWISLEDLDTIDDEGRKWVPIHKIPFDEHATAEPTAKEITLAETAEEIREERISRKPEESAAPGAPAGGIADMDGGRVLSLDDLSSEETPRPATGPERETAGAVREEPVVSRKEESLPTKEQETPAPEGYVDSNEEYMIWNMPDSEAVIAEPVQKPADRIVIPPAGENEQPGTKAMAENQPAVELPRKKDVPVREPDAKNHDRAADIPLSALKKIDRTAIREIKPDVRDSRPAAQAVFIDDQPAAGDRADDGVFEETRLDKIISGIVQVDEGSSYMLREADAEEDRKRVATVTDDFRPEYEEILEDLDYKYGDEEMDYIHTAIVEEDYSSYMREIDEFFGTRGGKTVSTRLELLGLTADEFDSIEDMLFKDEYRGINLYDRYHLYEFDRGAREDVKEDRRYRYLLPAEESLIDDERDSIEDDVSASSALIFEEDVQHIREQLKKRTGKTDVEVVALVERTFAERKEEERSSEPARPAEEPVAQMKPRVEPVVPPPAVEMQKPAPKEHAPAAVWPAEDAIRDITDRVVILEDQADVERFVKTFPEQKQVNIKMLLKYLDGLFERLPEEIIRKFASSDYFNLYLKVLNELGV